MNSNKDIESIKSVNIRSIDFKRQLLMSSAMVAVFESFLKESIGNEVLVINTNIGMEVYYFSNNDYSTFIRESILLYTLTQIDHKRLKFKNNQNREEVYQSFCQALITFSQYPQIFLAYAKKFIHLKAKNKSSRFVIPILNSFFEEVLKVLSKTGKVPHYEKIKKAKNKSHKSDLDKSIIENLISEILLKKHSN
ncbi:hypothetical protein IWQ47_004257 [Aquimarina sp. EL_43]|uniref:hypothetical protein n=1 Tax=unclassified Aquimarina TaxID=2627091 RepID=UPI0018C9A405|nr:MULTISPECIES: hypothetical protein [unclassified Aquimarina]MBG6133021.1 hypothetical protein [Aquimarina sp. EL_35]MBG6152332.1 hypothetical protein [Aquimarina sp. EL_32]MBG6171170.1 hypothetical protein [Aquimarina sp. EL_43]